MESIKALIERLRARADWLAEYPRNRLKDAKLMDEAAAALSAQGEAAQPAAEGWIDWPGLKQPVDDDTVIEFLADDGVIERRLARYMRWELPFEYRLPASPAASQDGGRE